MLLKLRYKQELGGDWYELNLDADSFAASEYSLSKGEGFTTTDIKGGCLYGIGFRLFVECYKYDESYFRCITEYGRVVYRKRSTDKKYITSYSERFNCYYEQEEEVKVSKDYFATGAMEFGHRSYFNESEHEFEQVIWFETLEQAAAAVNLSEN